MHLLLSIKKQVLTLYHATVITEYPVSTALNGAGEQEGSGCTPRGLHVIRAKVGENLPLNAVFVGRRFTGEVYSAELARQFPERDWILTRILWLSGKEPGCNRLGAVDSMRRYIYIHGTPDSEPMGIPVSHGCIRMRNADVKELYDRVPVGTELFIEE
ncbi:L,D-transpeptidase family protein [Neptunomonas sp.]|uniref:L,D-transpeptidase family protein n=1 Tax=Neptunomonas sp. TaxID=1971898 RepID=UPI003565A223